MNSSLGISHIKAPESKSDLAVKGRGHPKVDHDSTRDSKVAYEVSKPSVNWFWRRFLNVLPYVGIAATLIM